MNLTMDITDIFGIALGGGGALTLSIHCFYKFLLRNKPIRKIVEYDENGNIRKSDITYR